MPSPRARQIIALLLLIVGVQCWLLFTYGGWGPTPTAAVVLGVVLLLLLPPAVHRRAFVALRPVRRPSPRARHLTALLVWLVSTAYMVFTAWHQRRPLVPVWHDENSYLIQMQMMARGHLWMPRHPIPDFFDTFLFITDRCYASIYFPGTALAYLPTVWLGLPPWVLPVVVAGAAGAMTYLVVTRLLDGAYGLLAALMLLACSQWRRVSIMVMSHQPFLLLALLCVWAYLKWRGARRGGGGASRWAVLLGSLGGWALVTRPLDALCYLLPMSVAVAVELLRGKAGLRGVARTALLGAAGALPFVALQLISNVGITGRWLQYPHAYYDRRDLPGTSFSLRAPDLNARPVSTLVQKRMQYDVLLPDIRKHAIDPLWWQWADDRLPGTLMITVPHDLLYLWLPLGLGALLGGLMFGRRSRARRDTAGWWVLWAPVPLFTVAYTFYVSLNAYYPVVIVPGVALVVLLAGRALSAAWPRRRAAVATMFAAAVAVPVIASFPEIGGGYDELIIRRLAYEVNPQLARLPRKPAVVLFRYDPSRRPDGDVVFNTDAPWPDDAPVVRAHDLGERDGEIIRYYAATQPWRHFYLYDERPERDADPLTYLGTAADLARLPALPPALQRR